MAGPATFGSFVPKYVQRRVRYSLLYLLLFTMLLAGMLALYKGGVHLAQLRPENITIEELPGALALSFFRMTASFLACLVFAFALGLAAALNRTGERIIIPILDILQSIPVIAFFPAAISFFIGVAQGHRLGVEAAACFLIFTSQAWNMAFAVYEATKTIPQDNIDAITSFGVSGSRRFWKLYGPAAVPRLVYNSILSWSNGWYFLVACEIIALGPIRYHLPGIGSFLARAAEQDELRLVIWGLAALTLLILAMDFVVWRPASIWAERFRQDYSAGAESEEVVGRFAPHSLLVSKLRPLLHPAGRMVRVLTMPVVWAVREVLLPLLWDLPAAIAVSVSRLFYSRVAQPVAGHWTRLGSRARWVRLTLLWGAGLVLGLAAGRVLYRWLQPPWPALAREIPMALLASTGRLAIAIVLSLMWILPLVLWVWDKPRTRAAMTTLAQVGASLPAVALFPLIVLVAVRKLGGGMEAASIALVITGMQWYLLFNCLGGAAIIPPDLAEATRALGLSRAQIASRLVIPAIRPALITGLITAWGGGWNALVVSEFVKYKDETLTVNGIGALLNHAVYELGDNRAIMLCLAAMVGWILVINSLVWRPLYRSTAERYKFDS